MKKTSIQFLVCLLILSGGFLVFFKQDSSLPIVHAQGSSGTPACQFTYELTNRPTEQTDGITNILVSAGIARTPQINNKNYLCNSWYMNVAVDGFSAVSLALQDGQNTYTVGGGTAASWTNWEGTVNTGTNPTTAITSSSLNVTGYYPWISINLASSTGTGSIYVTLYGWKTPTLLGGIVGPAGPTGVAGPTGPSGVVATGTSALGTSAISSAACATVVTTTATGATTSNSITYTFNADPTAVTGFSPSASGMLTIVSYPTTGNVNFKVCNNTAGTVTPGAITLNWSVK